MLVVSHDRGFLNKATTATIFIHGKRLRYYGGNYDTFLKVRGRPMPSRGPSPPCAKPEPLYCRQVRAEHRANLASHQKQNERRVGHLKQFIARFGQGHKKMAKQARAHPTSRAGEAGCSVGRARRRLVAPPRIAGTEPHAHAQEDPGRAMRGRLRRPVP